MAEPVANGRLSGNNRLVEAPANGTFDSVVSRVAAISDEQWEDEHRERVQPEWALARRAVDRPPRTS